MSHLPLRPTLGAATLLLAAAAAGASVPAFYVKAMQYAAGEEASILVVPDGTGPALTAARAQGGAVIDARIRIQLVDQYGDPIFLYPWEDLWLQFADEVGTVGGCVQLGGIYDGGIFQADVNTDANGWTEWARPLRGGGWSPGPVEVYIAGDVARTYPDGVPWPPLPLRANSPDLTGDQRVNLSDIVAFVQDLLGSYAYRSDLNWDGVVDLVDIVLFTLHLESACD